MAKNYEDLSKLVTAMEKDYQTLQIFRENMVKHASESAGGNYGPNNDKVETPINLLSLYERIIMGHLVGADPRMMVSTFDRALKSMAGPFEESANKKLVKMKFGDTLRIAVKSASYLMGIIKVSITAPDEARFDGYKQMGEPGISNIAFEDFVCDMRAKKFSECSYMGHRYCILLEDAKKSVRFKKTERAKLQPKSDSVFNEGGDEKVSAIGRGGHYAQDGFNEYVEVWEIYLPREKKVVTFDADGDFEDALLVQDWIGPDCGPYHFLFFQEVLGNLMPKGPIMDLINMHREANELWMKLANQASRAKTVTAYRDEDEANKIKAAKDGDFVQQTNPDMVQEKVVHSGPNQMVANWEMNLINTYSEQAGNLRALGGLASQADTATQEKLVTQSASNIVNAMGTRVTQFSQDVMNAFAWFSWKSPHEEMKQSYAAPGVPDIRIERRLGPEKRFGTRFEDMDVRIDPYSLQHITPQNRIMVIDDVVKNFVIPLLPMFSQPGIGDLLNTYIRLKAKYTNCPDLIDLIEKLTGVQGPAETAANPTQPGQPAGEQETIHTRVSRPGMTDQAQQQVLQQLMAGGEAQPGGQGAQGLGQMSRAG